MQMMSVNYLLTAARAGYSVAPAHDQMETFFVQCHLQADPCASFLMMGDLELRELVAALMSAARAPLGLSRRTAMLVGVAAAADFAGIKPTFGWSDEGFKRT
jgi:hypothetical protein